MKKLIVLAFMALSHFAGTATNQAENPFPLCQPCDWVR